MAPLVPAVFGLVVNTIGQRLGFGAFLHASYRLSYRPVGQQHELLDELIGVFRAFEVAFDGLAFLVDVEVQLLALEFHGSVLEPLCPEAFGHAVEHDQFLGKLALIGVLLGGGRCGLAAAVHYAVLLENGLCLLIGKAPVTADDGVGQMPVFDIRLLVHLEDDAVAELVLVGAQRADVVAQSLGQHRDGAVDQIDARGALLCLLVDDASLGHIV